MTAMLLATHLLAIGQEFSSGVRADDDMASTLQASPQIAIDRQGIIYLLWSDYRSNNDGDVRLSRSTDGGVSFGPSRSVLSSATTISGMQRGARIAVDSNGVLHLLSQVSKKGGSGFDVLYQRSTDGGSTYTPPISLTNSTPKEHQDFPSIAIDGRNTIYVAWVDDRDVVAKTSSNTHLYTTRSTDGGATFSKPIRADMMPGGIGGTCECCNTDIAATGDGYVVVAFRSNINNRRDIFLARSVDAGQTFETAIPVQSEPWMINACPMAGPTVTMDREGTAHVAWRDQRASAKKKAYIYYATLRRGDSAASPDIAISDSPKESRYPSIAVTPSGIILCVSQDNRSDEADLFIATSRDGGNTFSATKQLLQSPANTAQLYPVGAVAPDGTYYVAWQEGSNDAGDIMLAKATSIPAVLPPESPLLNAPKGVIRPDQFSGFSWNTPSGLGRALQVQYQLNVESSTGWEQTDGIASTWWPSVFPVGQYRWFVNATTLTGVSSPSDTLSFTIATPSGVNTTEFVHGEAMLLLPNHIPAQSSSQLHVVLPPQYSLADQIEIALYDMAGACVARLFDGQLPQHDLPLSLPVLPTGMYRCQVQSTSMQSSAVLVVQ